MEKNANDEYVTSFQSAQQTDGAFMLLAYGGMPISGTDGEVARLYVAIPEDTENGDYEVILKDVECSIGSTITSSYTEISSVLTVAEKMYVSGYTISTTPIATTAGATNTIILNFAAVEENITDIEFDMEMPSCLSRTKNGRVTKAFESADENRMYVSGSEGDHIIGINGSHVSITAIVDDEYKYIAGSQGALVNMYYSTADGAVDGVYPIILSNITMKTGSGDVLSVAPTTSYIKVGTPTGASIEFHGHIAKEVNMALATESAITSVDMSKVISMDGILTLVDGRDFVAPVASVDVETIRYSRDHQSTWGTVCLPFALESDAAVQYYKLVSVSDDKMTFEPVVSVEAGVPVVFKNLMGNTLSIQATDVTLTKGDMEMILADDSWVMKGTYATFDNNPIDFQRSIYYVADDRFWYANEAFSILTFRGWFECPNKINSNVRTYFICIDDDIITNVGCVENKDGVEGTIFGLSGKPISVRQYDGIIINNGKKTVKR